MEWLANPSWGGIGTIATIVGLVVPAVIWWFGRKRVDHAPKPAAQAAQSVSDVHALADRFVELFRAHGIERTQVPRFLGPEFGITLSDLVNDERLIGKLDDNIIQQVCDRFGVRREWLEGTSEEIYPVHSFYKRPEEYEQFLTDLLKRSKSGKIGGWALRVAQPSSQETDALILLEEQIGSVGEKGIYRFHICNSWVYKYWKSRAYFAACIAISWRRKVYLSGREVDEAWLMSVCEGKHFIEHDSIHGGLRIPGWGRMWHPEDLALDPSMFLEHVDETYGIKAGLELWLALDRRGLMSLGAEQVFQGARARFEDRLLTVVEE